MLLIILASIGSLVLSLGLVYFWTKNKSTQFENKLKHVAAELNAAQNNERQLQNEIQTLNNKLSLTTEDPVTNLVSQKLFEERITQNIKESARYQFTMGVAFVDIDNFKRINEALGVEIGNALLNEVSQRLLLCIRQVDSMSRFYKDTFVVLLAQLAKPETAAVVAQRMLQAIAEPFQINGNQIFITACIGVAFYPTDGQDTPSLLRCAEHALHLAKEKGKHGYQFYQERMHAKSQRELAIYAGLSKESVFQEFTLYYQPIVNVQNETVICMDALLHWQHPVLGLISPAEIFNYAERQRSLNSISEWLLRNACRQFLYWRSLGFNPECIGIPLSIKQLENTQFIYRLSQVLQELEFNPEWLLLEIEESFSHVSFDVLEKAFNMLQYLGVKIAIDNFGSGSLSLRYLKNLKISYLKLDRSFVDDIVQNERTKALLKSVVSLAQNLTMQVIAQGVESDDQLAAVKQLGCTIMQGQQLGAPISERDVVGKMTASTP